MKLSKTTLLFLGVGIVVILLIGTSVVYAKQNDTKRKLAAEFAATEVQLARTSTDGFVAEKNELEAKLAQTNLQLETTMASLTDSVESISASQSILSVAKRYNVKVTEIESSGSKEAKVIKLECYTLPITVKVIGTTANIVSFVNGLTDKFGTGVVASAEINVPESPAEGELPEEIPDGQIPEEQPAGEQPAGEQPAGEQPAGEQPEGEQPVPGTTTATIKLQIYFYQGG